MSRFDSSRQCAGAVHAQPYLTAYRSLVEQRDALLDTLEDLQKAKQRAAVFTGELLLRRRAEGQAALLATLGQLEQALEERLQLLGQLPGGAQRTILLERYINGRSWVDIRRRLGYAERSVFTLHRLALASVERLLTGKE